MIYMLPDWLRDKAEPCGSRVTVYPAPKNKDADFLIEIQQADVSGMVARLASEGFKWEGATEHYQDVAGNTFMSWRKGEVNLIVTSNGDFAAKHRVATALCKRLNLLDKQDRIAVFKAVLYASDQW